MKPKRNGAFLTRLAQDTYGSTLAIMAAAFVPLIGLIGGGLDLSRVYLTKTRVQQACDAGALAGRKAMGAGSWTTSGTGNTRSRAYELFDANFQTGDYGTGTRTRQYTELDGTVTGTASAVVPMTLMKVFGKADTVVSVSCTAQMEIPNTDVMFVLDMTASMGCDPTDTGCAYDLTPPSDAKIFGLKSAVNCFYEALLRVNTAEPCSISPATDPVATTYDGTAQIRLGFVPYAVNVNVGKLLPNAFLSDNWEYQSRSANYTAVQTWEPNGSVSSTTWGSWSSAPTLNSGGGYSGWSDISTSGGSSVTINGTSYLKRPGGNSAQCPPRNTLSGSGNTMVAYTDSGSVQAVQDVSAGPVYPAAQQTLSYEQDDDHTATGYRYQWGTSGTDSCRLQRSNNRTYTRERSGSATRPITWTPYDRFDNWTYEQVDHDVSGLKAGVSAWNGSISVPRLATTTVSTRLSGSNTTANLTVMAPATVSWNGCIEERQTYRNTSSATLATDWNPIPAAALDMDINLVPTGSQNTQWGPSLRDVFWGRYTGTNTANRTTGPVTTTSDLDRNISSGVIPGDDCPQEARRLREYETPTDFETYVGALSATGFGTYHDIGLLWGARMLSPVGIFAADNDLTDEGGAIERHLIFMTDGNAQAFSNNLYAYGSAFWDRRQTSYDPSNTNLDTLVNSRLEALCSSIKNMNITLWVVYYGGNSSTANRNRLTACATPGKFFEATNTPALISNFKQIASDIADLRLTR